MQKKKIEWCADQHKCLPSTHAVAKSNATIMKKKLYLIWKIISKFEEKKFP